MEELAGRLVAEFGNTEASLDDRSERSFSSFSECVSWLLANEPSIQRSRVFEFQDGSALAEFSEKATTLYQSGTMSDDYRERRIDRIYQVLTNPTTNDLTAARRDVLRRELQELIASRSKREAHEGAEVHKHLCATCRHSFSHGEEDECPEISGEYFCESCFPTAHEHKHQCPTCADQWTHYGVPHCELPGEAVCGRHEETSHYDSRGLTAVAGMVEMKKLLYEDVIAPLRNPAHYEKYRVTIPNGILMFGPHGCGKTYIANRLAEELRYSFIEVNASSVADSYIHGTTKKIAELFSEAEKKAPSVLFLDEFEALVPSRSTLGAHQDYRVEEISEFLKQLASCAVRRILVIAATNEPWKIDPAVQRPGRLDKRILIDVPDTEARADMLRFHLEGRLRKSNLKLRHIAEQLDGYSASDLVFVVEEASRRAAKSNVPISESQLYEAVRLVPPSISAELRNRHKAFGQRGASG